MSVTKNQFRSRFAETIADIRAAQSLRQRVFFPLKDHMDRDQDQFDDLCRHVLIEETITGQLVGCFRFLGFETGKLIDQSYSGQFYDLSKLRDIDHRVVEMGRFCIDPLWNDSAILLTAWAAMVKHVDRNDIGMLFGCSSFGGTTPTPYLEAFKVLKGKYLAPHEREIGKGDGEIFDFVGECDEKPDYRAGMAAMPPLLRSYLTMGGWVSNHAVIDRQMNTIHVFTGLEIRTIPPQRKRILRALID